MSAEFSQLYQSREVLRAKITTLNDVASNVVRNRNWASRRVSTGISKAVNLQIDDQLKAEDPIQWGQNAIRAGRVNLGLAKIRPRYVEALRRTETELASVRERTPFGYIVDPLPEARDFNKALESKPMRGYLDEIPQEFGGLIKQFITSHEGRRILTVLADFEPSDPDQANNFVKTLSGAIFEQMGYLHLKSELEQQGTVLLSPSDVFTIYRNAFPDYSEKNAIADYGLNFGIKGFTIPDGLLISEKEGELCVDAITEYKSWVHPDKRRKSNLLQPETNFTNLAKDLGLTRSNPLDPRYLGNLVHALRPQLAAKPLTVNRKVTTIYAFPQNSQIAIQGGERKIIPIHSGDFGEFIDALKYLITSAI